MTKPRLELTWIGKDARPRLKKSLWEPRKTSHFDELSANGLRKINGFRSC